MTIRHARNALVAHPVGDVEVVLGRRDRDDRPMVSVKTISRSGVANVADPAVLRQLIADLQVGLAHLEATP